MQYTCEHSHQIYPIKIYQPLISVRLVTNVHHPIGIGTILMTFVSYYILCYTCEPTILLCIVIDLTIDE